MKLFITLLGTICILPLAAFALECIQCFAKNSDSCVGPSVVCKKAKECMVLSELYHIDHGTFHTVKKDCNELYSCGKTMYSSNHYELTLRAHIECCKGDNCNTFNYKTPPLNGELNGNYCSSCFRYGLKECKNKRMIRCEEIIDKCYNYIGKIRNPDGKEVEIGLRGCFSPEICVLGFKSLVGATEIVSALFNCSDQIENI